MCSAKEQREKKRQTCDIKVVQDFRNLHWSMRAPTRINIVNARGAKEKVVTQQEPKAKDTKKRATQHTMI
jgi:hypothetical protein